MPSESEFQVLVEAENERTAGPCPCCGNMTRRVWGYVSQGDVTVAAYFVEWTPGHQDRAANFDLIIGAWGRQRAPVIGQGHIGISSRPRPDRHSWSLMPPSGRSEAARLLVRRSGGSR